MGKILDNRFQNNLKVIIQHYNFITGSDVTHQSEIPIHVYMVLSALTYRELCKPLVAADLFKGLTLNQVCIKYKLPVHICRQIGREVGVFKNNPV